MSCYIKNSATCGASGVTKGSVFGKAKRRHTFANYRFAPQRRVLRATPGVKASLRSLSVSRSDAKDTTKSFPLQACLHVQMYDLQRYGTHASSFREPEKKPKIIKGYV